MNNIEKRYTLNEAREEARQIKDLTGEKSSKEDIELAEQIIEQEKEEAKDKHEKFKQDIESCSSVYEIVKILATEQGKNVDWVKAAKVDFVISDFYDDSWDIDFEVWDSGGEYLGGVYRVTSGEIRNWLSKHNLWQDSYEEKIKK